MNKSISIFIIGILLLGSFSGIAISKEITISIVKESITISEPIITEIEEFVTVTFKEENSQIIKTGKPTLPSITKVYTFPFGTQIKNVDVAFSEKETYALPKQIIPVQQPVLVTSTKFSKDMITDETVCSSGELYPKETHTIQQGAGLQSNDHVMYLVIRCHPVQYSSEENLIHVAHKIDITVNYQQPEIPLLSTDKYDMIIIAPDKFSQQLQPLIAHKNSHNVLTMLKPIEEIYAEYQGRDEAEQIKYFIKDAIESWGISYVLLVGSIDTIPMRKTDIRGFITEELPTDLYYADIYDANGSFDSWDSNQNDVFGEFYWNGGEYQGEYIDEVDLYPDVKIGRLPSRYRFEVNIVVDKIITYETEAYGQDWFNRMVLMGGDTFPWYETYEGEVVTEYIAQHMSEFEHIKLWTSKNNFHPRSINREISKGAGFVSYSGHGYPMGIGTYPLEQEDIIRYNVFNLLGMLNGRKLPIICYEACLTAKLDYNVNGVKIPCFAWNTLRKPFGGAIAVIGSTGIGYGGLPGDPLAAGCPRLNAYFFEAYEPGISISRMLTSAQNEYLNNVWKDCITLEEFNLLGDPSLKIGGYQ